MDIKKIIREEIEKLNEEIQSDLVLPKGKRVVLQADNPEVNRGLVVTWLEKGGYDVEYWYKDPSKIYPAEVIIDGKPITKDGKVVHLGYHPELDEGFGSDEFLTKTEKKKFEKERLENAEVLGYTLTGTKDIKESINEAPKKATVDMMKALLKFGDPMPKPIWNALTMMVRGYGLEYVKREVKKNPKDFYKNLKQMARAFPEFSKKPKNYKFNEASLSFPTYKTNIGKFNAKKLLAFRKFLSKHKLMQLRDFIMFDHGGRFHIHKSSITPKIKKDMERKFKIRLKESTKEYGKTLVNMIKDRKLKMLSSKDKKTLLKIAKMMKRANESVFAVNLDKEKNDERYPEQPNINYDPEKGKTRIRKIRK